MAHNKRFMATLTPQEIKLYKEAKRIGIKIYIDREEDVVAFNPNATYLTHTWGHPDIWAGWEGPLIVGLFTTTGKFVMYDGKHLKQLIPKDEREG